MYRKERIEQITEQLKENGYLTVRYLTSVLHYSTATINRDLNDMEAMGLVRRTWGGVEPIEEQHIPLLFRYDKMKPEKIRMAKRAAELVKDGDTIMIDGTTTTQYIGEALIGKHNLHVITNNLALAPFLAERGIRVTVTGGNVAESPYMLDGEEAVDTVLRYRADICFLSGSSLSTTGEIGVGDLFFALHRAMLRQSAKSYLLCDHEKIGHPYTRSLCSLDALSGVISDFPLPDSVKSLYPNVAFFDGE